MCILQISLEFLDDLRMDTKIDTKIDMKMVTNMNSDRFENWCTSILYLSYTLYILSSLKEYSSVDEEVFEDILEPLKTKYFSAIDILTTMGCNMAAFLDTTEVTYVTFYKATIDTLRNLPRTALFTDSTLKRLVLELETKRNEECDRRQKIKFMY